MKKNNLKINVMFQALYQLLLVILPLITSPYVSRVLGPEGIGIYSYTFSIVNYFVIFGKLGIDTYANRKVARVKDDSELLNKTFSSIFFLHLLITIIVAIIYLIYVIFFSQYRFYALIQSFYILAVIADINWLFYGLEEFKLTVTRNAIIRFGTVIAIFIFVNNQSDLYLYLFILSFGTFLSQTSVWYFLKHYVSLKKVEWKQVKVHFKPMITLFIPTIAVTIYTILDKIMLGSMAGAIHTGYYENAEKIINTCIGVIIAFGNVMMPRMSNLVGKGEKEKTERYISISIQLVMLLSLGMAFGLSGIAYQFVPLFFGEAFIPSIYVLIGLSFTLPFRAFANVIRTQYLIPNHYDKIYIISVFIGAIVNIIINFLLIPILASYGVVIGTIVAELLVCFLQAFAVKEKIPIYKYIKDSAFFIINGIVMYIVIFFIGKYLGVSVYTTLIQVVLGAFLYSSLTLLYLYITKGSLWIMLITEFNKIKRKSF